jgi:hypothetical protein
MRSVSTLLTAMILVALGGCPDRDDAIDTVGGAPHRTVEDARVKADAAEVKLQKAADRAAAAGTD